MPRQLGEKLREELRTCAGNSSAVVAGHFKDVVLVISFAHDVAAEQGAQFLRRLYSRVFGAVVLVSQNAIPRLGVQGTRQNSSILYCMPH